MKSGHSGTKVAGMMVMFLSLGNSWTPAYSQTSSPVFSDSSQHWANACIRQLSSQRLVTGYPDNTFRPQGMVTRAEFAVLMLNAFPQVEATRRAPNFKDVPSNHWAYNAIRNAYAREFFSGYPDGTFRPSQAIPRVQAIAILANAAKMSSNEAADIVLKRYYDDASQVPEYAKKAIAAGTIGNIVVNYPNLRQLRPNQSSTRGEIAAFLCQSLGFPRTISKQYIAGDNLFSVSPTLGGYLEFKEGLAVVLINQKFGYMDTQGNLKIQPQFEDAHPFSEGYAAVKINGKWGFIDKQGKIVMNPTFAWIPEGFSDGLARVYADNNMGMFINKNFQTDISPVSNAIQPYSEGLTAFQENGKWGYINKSGNLVIPAQFEEARAFKNGLAPVRIRLDNFTTKWGYIDTSGKIVIQPQFFNAQPFSENLAAVEIGIENSSNRWAYIDTTGKVVIAPQFFAPSVPNTEFRGNIVTPFSAGIALARKGEEVGFIDKNGNWKPQVQIKEFRGISEGLARVNIGGTWVREQIGCTQASGCDYALNLKGGKWGYVLVPQPGKL